MAEESTFKGDSVQAVTSQADAPKADAAVNAPADAGKPQQVAASEDKAETTFGEVKKVAQVDLKLPEGMKEMSQLAKFKELAAEFGLKSEQAQKIFDLFPEALGEADKASQEKMKSAHEEMKKSWKEAMSRDSDFNAQNRDSTISSAESALKKFGSAELGKLLRDTGLAQHPEVIKAFARVGKEMSEDTIRGTLAAKSKPSGIDYSSIYKNTEFK